MTRLYKKGSIDSSESEEDPDETDNSNFEETLYKSVAEAVGIVKRQPSDHDGYKSLSREFAWYLETGKKKHKPWTSLSSIVDYFSNKCCMWKNVFISGWQLNQRRARMNDSTLDDLVFLKYFYSRKTKYPFWPELIQKSIFLCIFRDKIYFSLFSRFYLF